MFNRKVTPSLNSLTNRRGNTARATTRILARLMWKRWTSWTPKIPKEFPLQSFRQFPTKGLDDLCFTTSLRRALKIAEDHVRKRHAIYFHPIWLFQRGKLNQRGPFYEAFRVILAVDSELKSLSISRKFSIKIARDLREYQRNIVPTSKLNDKLLERGTDIFAFFEENGASSYQIARGSSARLMFARSDQAFQTKEHLVKCALINQCRTKVTTCE